MNKHTCHCTNHRTPTMGKYECVAFVRGNVAYALDALPATHVEAITGTPWAQATIHLCGTHHAQFINRKPINISVQEDTIMSTIYTTNHMFPMFSLDALIDRAADMWSDQAEYVRDFHDEVDMDMGYPVWFNNYTARIDRLSKVIDNRQFIEFWMKNPVFPMNSLYFTPTKSEALRIQDWENAGYDMSDGFTKSNAYIVQEDTMEDIEICSACGAEDAICQCMIEDPFEARLRRSEIEEFNIRSKEEAMNNITNIINSNAVKENNVPNSPVTGSADRGDKWIKCVKCSKEVGTWYHANVADVRTCMGAAPAPVKRVYKTDVLTGETVLTNSNLRFFYDSSKVVVFAKAKELREAGVHVFKVARATKGNKDWYVQYVESKS